MFHSLETSQTTSSVVWNLFQIESSNFKIYNWSFSFYLSWELWLPPLKYKVRKFNFKLMGILIYTE